MAYERSETARDNFGKFIHQFKPETKTLIKKPERILIKSYRQNVSWLSNQTCVYIYIYIYIYCHPQTDCFVLSELFSVARPAGRSKPRVIQSPKDLAIGSIFIKEIDRDMSFHWPALLTFVPGTFSLPESQRVSTLWAIFFTRVRNEKLMFRPFVSMIWLKHVTLYVSCPVGWGYRIHRLLLCRGARPPTTTNTNNEYPGYDTKQSDGEVPVILELWGMWVTSSFPLLPGPLWPGMVAPDRVLSMGQI